MLPQPNFTCRVCGVEIRSNAAAMTALLPAHIQPHTRAQSSIHPSIHPERQNNFPSPLETRVQGAPLLSLPFHHIPHALTSTPPDLPHHDPNLRHGRDGLHRRRRRARPRARPPGVRGHLPRARQRQSRGRGEGAREFYICVRRARRRGAGGGGGEEGGCCAQCANPPPLHTSRIYGTNDADD